MEGLKIVAFEKKYEADFKRLNLEWLDGYNLTEPADLLVLDNPQKEVLEKGGFIWLAVLNKEVVGTAALLNEGHGIFELAKMSVTKAYQGKGISKILIEKCLEKAKETGLSKLILYSNSQLKAALKLYSTYGFVHVEMKDSPFSTADVKMELSF